MNSRRTRIYEGKAKILYEGPEPGTLVVHYKDFDYFIAGDLTGSGLKYVA